MRDIAMELRGLADEESAAPVFASKVADAVARRAGKRRLVKHSAVGAGSALAVGGLAVGGVIQATRLDIAPFGGVEATPTVAPETYVAVAYDSMAVDQAFEDVTPIPGCDERADIEPRSEHGLSVVLELASEGISGDYNTFVVGFRNDRDEELTFIASTPAVVLVQDGVVASDPSFFEGPARALNASPERPTVGNASFSFDKGFTCASIKAWDDQWELRPGEDASAEEMDAWTNTMMHIGGGPLDPGEYTAYAWTPVMFGEQAGAARVWQAQGYYDLSGMSNPAYTSSPLYGDTSLTRYCYSLVEDPTTRETTRLDGVLPENPNIGPWTIDGVEGEVVHFDCDVPPEIAADKLRRLVPESYINDYEMTYLVSEPITFTIE